jgi:hypothetical protein
MWMKSGLIGDNKLGFVLPEVILHFKRSSGIW